MRTSVVLVSYRPNEWLDAALRSVVAQADQVILVDNGSADAVAAEAGRRNGAVVLRSDRNLGFSGAVNRGLAAATGDVLALLNDDAIAAPDWLERSLPGLADPETAAIAPKLLLARPFAELRFDDDRYDAPADPRRLGRMVHEVTVAGRDVLPQLLGGIHRVEHGDLAGVERTWRWTSGRDAVYVPLDSAEERHEIEVDGAKKEPVRVVDLVNSAGAYLSIEGHAGDYGWETADDGQFDVARECFGAPGAAMVFTRSTLDRVGPFPDRFFAYYEDVDWSWRARLGGQRIRYEPSAVVRHVRSATSGGEADARVRLLSGRNRMHALARNAPMRVVWEQTQRLKSPDLPRALASAARRRVLEGLTDRLRLRRRWELSPSAVWDRWAGVDERWSDPGAEAPRVHLPPRLQFGE